MFGWAVDFDSKVLFDVKWPLGGFLWVFSCGQLIKSDIVSVSSTVGTKFIVDLTNFHYQLYINLFFVFG